MTQYSRKPVVVVAISVLLVVVGTSTFNMLPLLTEGVARSLGFSEKQIGAMSLAISVGSGASSLFSGMWVRSVRWSRAAFMGLGAMLVASLLAMLVKEYWAFVLLQGVTGALGGSVLALAWTILSDRDDASRSFGIAVTAQVAYQVGGLLIGPTLLRVSGLNGILGMLAGTVAVAMCVAPLLPDQGRTVLRPGASIARFDAATFIALLGCGVFFVNAGAYWTYIQPMGHAQGISSSGVANCIAVGVSAGLLGGIGAWALGQRLGRLRPLGVAGALTIGAALMLSGPFGVRAFLISNILYGFSWNYSVAYQLAAINAVDPTGRGVAIAGAFSYLGSAAGAALAALFITPSDYGAVIWLVVLAVCLSSGLFVLSQAIGRYSLASVKT